MGGDCITPSLLSNGAAHRLCALYSEGFAAVDRSWIDGRPAAGDGRHVQHIICVPGATGARAHSELLLLSSIVAICMMGAM